MARKDAEKAASADAHINQLRMVRRKEYDYAVAARGMLRSLTCVLEKREVKSRI
jgi:hypothetical protein